MALLSADLPALRPGASSDAALAAAAGHGAAFVADASGTGTTLLATAPGRPVEPRYGRASAAAHRAAGAVELTGDWPSLRHDVDTAADLRTAAELGLGPATSALDRRATPSPARCAACRRRWRPSTRTPAAGPC